MSSAFGHYQNKNLPVVDARNIYRMFAGHVNTLNDEYTCVCVKNTDSRQWAISTQPYYVCMRQRQRRHSYGRLVFISNPLQLNLLSRWNMIVCTVYSVLCIYVLYISSHFTSTTHMFFQNISLFRSYGKWEHVRKK